MSKQPRQIKWDILDERPQSHAQSDEPVLQAVIAPAAPWPARRNYRLRLVASIVTLLLLSSAIWLWRQAQAGLDHVQTDLQRQTEGELWAVAQGNSALTNKPAVDLQATTWNSQFQREDEMLKGLQGDDPDSHLQVGLHLLELENEWAKAQITAQEAGSGDTYRQTRFFRHTEQGWQRTSPTAEAWGPPTSLESTYFIFHFRQHDAGVVAEVAPLLDALYRKLRGQFGLPPIVTGGKSIIEVTPTERPGAAMLRPSTPGRYVVSSPDVYLAPVSVSNAELLLQSLALLITRDMVDEVIGYYEIKQLRPHSSSGLSLWALWDADLPLSVWHQGLVRWRLGSEEGQDQGSISRLPEHYEEICVLYQVWLASPALVSIPLTCSEDTQSTIAVTTPNTLSRASLDELLINFYWPLANSQSNHQWFPRPGDTVILTTFFEYLVSRYGRNKLPLFLAALGKNKDWETLCRIFFGQSTAEFAAGWQEFLTTHYGITREIR